MVNTIGRRRKGNLMVNHLEDAKRERERERAIARVEIPNNNRIRTSILGGKTVERVISLGLSTDEAREGVGGEGTGVAAVLVNIANVDLDRGVVLGTDKAVSGRAINA
jgi:hypothetical protein